MSTRIRLGMLTPSSNTTLEPVVSHMVQDLPEVSVHFGRFRVVEISLRQEALGQFALDPVLTAARLLADARVDVIAWNGTSAGWLGLESDVELCRVITTETGIPATTSILALDEIMRRTSTKRFGLVTPYLHAVQERILANYAAQGYDCIAERHFNDPGNFSFAEFTGDAITAMIRKVAEARPDCVVTFCTNLRAAPLVETLEAELGLPIYDTISVVVWKCLVMCGVAPDRVRNWGGLFRGPLARTGASR